MTDKWQDTVKYNLPYTVEGFEHQAEVAFKAGEEVGILKGMRKVLQWHYDHHLLILSKGTPGDGLQEELDALFTEAGMEPHYPEQRAMYMQEWGL